MDKMRQKHIAEMHRLQDAILRTKSEYLIADYTKAYRRMARELMEYDKFRNQKTCKKRTEKNL